MAEKKTKKETAEEKPVKAAEKAVKGVEKVAKAPKKEPKTAKPSEKEVKIQIPTRLAEFYKKEITPSLMKKFNYKSIMQVPKLHKIVVNMGVGAAVSDAKLIEEAAKELETITGQKPSIRKAKKAISNFKMREGVNIGCMVTLRQERMYEFMRSVPQYSFTTCKRF